VQAHGFDGDQHACAEFLRLGKCPAGQRLSGNAGGKTEVVLDARARARLPAEGARIDHHSGEAFGGGVDRCREPGRTGAGDDHVEDVLVVVGVEHADAPGQFAFRRIAQHAAVGTDDQRKLLGGGRIPFDHQPGIGVLVRIQQHVRDGVAGQEVAQSRDAGRFR